MSMVLRHYPKEVAKYDTRTEKPASRDKILDTIAKAAFDNDRAYEGCSRCVLSAIQWHLRLTNDEAFRGALKASTALAAGIARRGETCGALIGAVMAVGLAVGAERLDDFDSYAKSMEAAAKIFDKFKSHFGTVKCFEIQEKFLGRHYDFCKDKDVEAWYKEGGLDVCPGVCATAARISAEVILSARLTYTTM